MAHAEYAVGIREEQSNESRQTRICRRFAVRSADPRLVGRFTLGLSPASLLLAYLDWLVHLANARGKQAELIDKAQRKAGRLALAAIHSGDASAPPVINPLPQDRRFDAAAWHAPRTS